MQAPVLPHVICDLYHAEYLLLTLFRLRSWTWWSCLSCLSSVFRIVDGPFGRQSKLRTQSQTKQANKAFSGALIKLAYWSWYLYIVEYHSLVSTIPYCSHVAFINSCLLADCDPTNSNICRSRAMLPPRFLLWKVHDICVPLYQTVGGPRGSQFGEMDSRDTLLDIL